MSRFKSNRKTQKRATVTRVHAKFGQLCELDPGHVPNKIGQQQKITTYKNCVCLRNFATLICEIMFCDIIVMKFCDIW
jgi:hypothetical protein